MQQEINENLILGDDELAQFDEFKRQKRLKEAQATVQRLEYDLSCLTLDKEFLKKEIKRSIDLNLGAVCVLPCFVKPVKSQLTANKKIAVIALISHLHGGDTQNIKKAAVARAIKDGADEVEVTAPIALIKNGNWSLVKREFKRLKGACKNRAFRVNIESPLLNSTEIVKTCSVAADSGVNAIVTASGAYGFSNDVETVKAVKNAVKDKCFIKVNGIENRIQMQEICEFGVAKCGAKNAVDIAQLIMSFAEKT